jgi:hypothetical protein
MVKYVKSINQKNHPPLPKKEIHNPNSPKQATMDKLLTNYTVNFNPVQTKKYLLTWTPYSKEVLTDVVAANGFGGDVSALKKQLQMLLEKGVHVTDYYRLTPGMVVRCTKEMQKLVGAKRWFVPEKVSTDLKLIMCDILFIVQSVESHGVIGQLFHTDNVLNVVPSIPSYVHMPMGFYATAVRRNLPHNSTGYIIGNHVTPAESTLLCTLEHIPKSNSARYQDILDLGTVYYNMAWSPEICVHEVDDAIQVIYPEDDGSIDAIVFDHRVQIRHLEVYLFQDLLRYALDLARAGYVLYKWSSADWRLSQWNTLSRKLILISSQSLRLEEDTTLESRFNSSFQLLMKRFCLIAERRDDIAHMNRYSKFSNNVKKQSDDGLDILCDHLAVLYRQHHPPLVPGYTGISSYQPTRGAGVELTPMSANDDDTADYDDVEEGDESMYNMFEDIDNYEPQFFSSPMREYSFSD